MQELRWIFGRAFIFTLFAIILFTTAQARAAITEYGNLAYFEEAAGAYIVETWDESPSGTIIDSGSPYNVGTISGITYNYIQDPLFPRTTVTNFMVSSQLSAFTSEPNTLGITPVGDGTDPGAYPYFTYDGVQFVFSKPINYFGIDIITLPTNPYNFVATTDQGIAHSVDDSFPEYSEGQFLGFSSNIPFYSVTITYPLELINDSDIVLDGWTLDTMRISTPLPPSMLLLGSGLVGLGLLRFRKRFRA
jgi:hypothetical protein